MTTIIGWKPNGDNIILKCLGQEEFDLELPNDIYKEILKDGPPNNEKLIRDLITKIHQVRIERILTVESVDKKLDDIGKKEEECMDKLIGAKDKLEVDRWSAIERTLAGRRSNQSQRRHLVKLLHQEEGALSKELTMKL
jgi:hypothetical protein